VLAEAQPGAYALKRAVLLEKSFSCNPAVHVFEKLFPWNPPTWFLRDWRAARRWG